MARNRNNQNFVRTQEELDRAFNLGCDARLIGEPISWCCFDESDLRKEWKSGWRDVDRSWGKGAKWYVKPLPKICFDQ